MNLRIADSAGLVAFLHRVIGETGHTVVATPESDVVQVGEVFFIHRIDPVSVGGPFLSVKALVRSEGVRRHPAPGHIAPSDPADEVFEWADSFFRFDAGSDTARQFNSLEAALADRGGPT